MCRHGSLLTMCLALGALLSFGTASAQVDSRLEQQVRQSIVARLLDRANALEREWPSLRKRIHAWDASKNLPRLECLFLNDCNGGGEPETRFSVALRKFVNDDPPCEQRPCPAKDLLRNFEERPSGSRTKGTYVDCVLENFDFAVKEKAKSLRSRAPKALTEPTGNLRDFLNDVLGEVRGGESCIKPSGPERFAVGTIPLSVEWNSQCTKDARILRDGTAELYQPAVAALLHENDSRGKEAFCTGTLIAPNAVLTAAHCFCKTDSRGDRGSPFYPTYSTCQQGYFRSDGEAMSTLGTDKLSVYFQHAGEFEAERVILQQGFRWIDVLPRADLAIVLLKEPVTGIEPAVVDSVRALRYSAIGTGVGFGYSNPIDATGRPANFTELVRKTGLKLAARIQPSPCFSYERGRKLICWDSREQAGGTLLGSTCSGDSGGPLFVEAGGRTYLTGVTSAGTPGCALGTRAYDIEVFHFRRWIDRVLRAFPAPEPEIDRRNARQARCRFYDTTGGTVPPEDGGTTAPEELHIDQPGVKRLRVSLNCTWSGGPTKLSLTKKGAAAAATCQDPGLTTAASCEVATKQGDDWRIEFATPLRPDCQLVATTFE